MGLAEICEIICNISNIKTALSAKQKPAKHLT